MNKFICFLYVFICLSFSPVFAIQDDFVLETIVNKELSKPETHTSYNYQSTEKIPVQLTVTERIKSENDVYEGQIIKFEVKKDVVYNNEIVIKSGTVVPARVETTIPSGMNGIPASIIVGGFKFSNIDEDKLTYSHEIIGQDRSLIVYPIKWALTILPPTGSLTNFIMGGHAKLSTKKVIKIYYYPDWI